MSGTPCIRIAAHGGPEVIEFTSTETPSPGPGQIRVRNSACGVNFIDTYHRTGLYPVPMPSGLGLEGAGTVEAVGDGVSDLQPGQRVAYGTGPIGAYAGSHILPAERVVPVSDGIEDDIAASIMLKGLTTWYLLRELYDVKARQTVLFHAGAGGVGQIALQWLKDLGATVITTTGSSAKAEVARSLGADHVLDYAKEDIAARVREITDGRGVDVVYDGVGKSTWEASLDSLRPRGMMVSFGNASGPVTDVDLGILAKKGSLYVTRPTLAHYTATTEDLRRGAAALFGVIEKGAVKISPPTVYPLAEAAQCHRDLEGRKTTGSLILRP